MPSKHLRIWIDQIPTFRIPNKEFTMFTPRSLPLFPGFRRLSWLTAGCLPVATSWPPLLLFLLQPLIQSLSPEDIMAALSPPQNCTHQYQAASLLHCQAQGPTTTPSPRTRTSLPSVAVLTAVSAPPHVWSWAQPLSSGSLTAEFLREDQVPPRSGFPLEGSTSLVEPPP